jgi:lysyl-tRNA synthetase class 2
MYMRANELYLKDYLLVDLNGCMNQPQLCNEGMDRTHNLEFTVLEFYVAYKDYE